MMKRYFFLMVCLLSVAIISHAALPALVLPVVAEAVEALVIRSAGRQIVTSLSTAAANDTTFAAAVAAVRGTQVAAWLGFGAVTAAFPGDSDAPVSPTLAKEKYSVAVGPIGTTADYKPKFISPGYKMDSPEYGKFVYGTTREEAMAALMVALRGNAEWVSMYGNPVSWRPYKAGDGSTTWNDPARPYWTVEIHTDGYYNDLNQTGHQRYIYPAEPVEPRDGQRRILYNGKTFEADQDDPDWGRQDAADFGYQRAIGFVGKGSNNEPLRVGLTAQDANIRITEDVQGLTPDGKPQVISRVLDIAPGTGQATATSAGTQVGTTLETQPADWSGGATSGTSNSGGWPDDYARQVTLTSVDVGVGKIAKSSEEIKDILSKKEELPDPAMPDASELNKQITYAEQFKDLLSWKMPAVTSECPVVEYQNVISGYTFDIRIDAHCQLMTADHKKMLDAIMIAVWAIMAMWIVLEA